ncbi:release factor glutamine methyltransferase [Lactococcus formosensis]|nr:Release factor glutamine methyltransferase [Lactococcus formosensis]BDW49846.1 release factor glutamine methyltransferase [Lactococcus formosensis]BDX25435.1 release factor glutamine methyltransferase [Lactococcus formosensis]
MKKMLWIVAVRQLSQDLEEPFALEFVWRNLHGLTKLQWLNLQRENISDKDLVALSSIAQRLENNEPPQYIVGWAEFCDLKLAVDERVLIPRPETEELVQMILSQNDQNKHEVLDIGTGSGAIALALAQKRNQWEITASDLSEKALDLAQLNAKTHQLSLNFILSDVFENISGQYDIIVSNPPYISFDETYEMDQSVIRFEPDSALFAEKQGLEIYQKIAEEARQFLKPEGKIYLEIGYKQGSAVKDLFEKAFPTKKVRVHRDIFEKDRMISVT